MQKHSLLPPQAVVGRAASSGFVPPSWADLSPLLISSTLIWTSILFLAAARSAIHRYFQTESFRRIVRKARRYSSARGPLVRLAGIIRYVRMLLVRNRFPESTTAFWFGLPRFTAGVVICILYIIDTYMKGVPTHFYAFQCVYGVAVSLNLFVSFIYAERPVLFAFSLKTIIECLSIPSLLFASGARWLNFNFLQAYCILVEWALLEKHDIVMRNHSALARLLINLFLQMLTFLFVTSCGVQFFELLGDPVQALRSETFQITWANSVYFAVVTLMTVGYGDFVPYTLFGRMWIVFHIIFAAYLVSREISLLIDALKSMRRGGGSYVNSSGTEHVVVTGRVKWEFLQQFVKEFLAEPSNLDTRVIVLTSKPTWSDDDWQKFVSHNPFFDHHLMFLEGSALKMDDLSRAHIHAARGVFVLADPHRQDPYKEDSDILKAVLTIRNYSGTVPIYALNTLHESSFQFGIAMEHTDPVRLAGLGSGGALPFSPTLLGLPQTPTPRHARDRTRGEHPGVHDAPRKGVSYGGGAPMTGASGDDVYPDESHGALDSATVFSVGETERPNGANDIQSYALDEAAVSSRTRRQERRAKMRNSESLCMQELETVLLAENTFCNGLSTLIANATLRVAPQSHRNDRPWLVEYKLGAECSIQQFIIRKQMDGLVFREVATIFQDYGLVLLAIRRKSESNWTLLTTETILEASMSTMALSYHDHSVIDRIADIAAKFIEENKINKSDAARTTDRHPEAAGPVHSMEFQNSSIRNPYKHFDSDSGNGSDDDQAQSETTLVPVLGHGTEEASSSEKRQGQDQLESGKDGSQRTKTLSKSSITRSMSTSTASSLKKEEERAKKADKVEKEKKGTGGGVRIDPVDRRRSRTVSKEPRRRLSSRRGKVIYSSVDKLPAALLGHVIICLDGESPLINLDVLLRRIWIRRAGQRKKAPVVVIHPRFPKNYARALGGDLNGLFLLQGNSLSLETLKQAQYQSARAFLIMASESNEAAGHGSTDSKAIFTVMTLDSLLSAQDTFVCCILDAEESLQLLRAPKQPRRIHVNLGEQREPDLFNYEPSPMAGIPKRTASSTSFVRSLPTSPFVQNYTGYSPYGTFSGVFGQYAGTRYPRARNNKATRLRLKGMTRSSSMRLDAGEESSEDEEEHGDVQTLRDQHNHQQRSREELYERQRYASGELVISSLFTALLARDYTDPGYIRLIRQLIGTSSGSSGSWVRQVEIPESWTRVEKAIDGRTYRETSMRLLEMGCIALGLYRSGDAPVRVETKSEQWERGAGELVYLEEEEISMMRSDVESKSVASRIISDSYSNRMHGRAGPAPPLQDVGGMQDPLIGSNRTSFSDRLFLVGDEVDAFDQMYYTCPTTNRRIFYQEAINGENVLPYVYTCPEPYSLVAASDAVFVLCDPSKEIPSDWGED